MGLTNFLRTTFARPSGGEAAGLPASLPGAQEEMGFWRGAIQRYLKDQSNSFFTQKLDPARPFEPAIAERIRLAVGPDATRASLLDVGCGPASTLGKRLDGLDVQMVGLDPLAGAYQALFEEFGLTRPHLSVTGVAEEASAHFGDAAFDYVHADNSLDHCQDIPRALSELRKVCKPDGVLFFRMFVNEGEHNHYAGLHQWNFDSYNGKVVFWRPGEIHFIDEVLPLPILFWNEERMIGPNKIRRDFLNCEIHNTDLSRGFVDVGGMQARYLERYSAIVLKRARGFDPDARPFAHFVFEDRPRHVATLVWPPDHGHHILPVPAGQLKSVKLGQSRKRVGPAGEDARAEVWSAFLPGQELS